MKWWQVWFIIRLVRFSHTWWSALVLEEAEKWQNESECDLSEFTENTLQYLKLCYNKSMPRGLWGSRVSCVIEAHSDSLLTVRFFVHFCVDSVVFFHIIHFIMDFFSVNMTGVFISVRRRLRSSSVPIALHLSWMRMWPGERWHIWSTLLSWLLFWCCCRSLAGARHRHGNVHHVQLPWPFGRIRLRLRDLHRRRLWIHLQRVHGNRLRQNLLGLPRSAVQPRWQNQPAVLLLLGIATVVDKISNQMILKRLTMYFIIPTGDFSLFYPLYSVFNSSERIPFLLIGITPFAYLELLRLLTPYF